MPSKTTTSPAIQPGEPIALGHTPEVAQAYRDAVAPARHRQASGLPPATQAVQPATPQASRVDAGLASQARDKRVGQLQADLMRYEKELQRPAIGMTGAPVAHLIERQKAVEGVCQGIRIEMEQLAGLSRDALVRWAEGSGAIRWTQGGNAVL